MSRVEIPRRTLFDACLRFSYNGIAKNVYVDKSGGEYSSVSCAFSLVRWLECLALNLQL